MSGTEIECSSSVHFQTNLFCLTAFPVDGIEVDVLSANDVGVGAGFGTMESSVQVVFVGVANVMDDFALQDAFASSFVFSSFCCFRHSAMRSCFRFSAV
jgi:hypothetical protein